jgi:hypothetical protein
MGKIILFLVGGGGLSRDMAAIINATETHEVAGYWDDKIPEEKIAGCLRYCGTTDDLLHSTQPVSVLIAIGNPQVRRDLYEKITWPIFIHPLAFLADKERISIGEGTVIFPGAVLTADIRVGENSLVHVGASLHHDTLLGAHCVIMPGARITGGAALGAGSFLGAGICLAEKRRYPEKTSIKEPN